MPRYKIKFKERNLESWWNLRNQLSEDDVKEDLLLMMRGLIVITVDEEYCEKLLNDFPLIEIKEDVEYDQEMTIDRIPGLLKDVGEATMIHSFIFDDHPILKKITKLGPSAVPTLIDYLKRTDFEKDEYPEGIWYALTALHQILDPAPIVVKEAGSLPDIIKAWLDWDQDRQEKISSL